MKKLALLGLALLGVCGCSDAPATGKKFVVGFDADFPPYGFKDGNTYKGFDLDLAREVCARKGWTFVANPINWDTKDMELNSGAIDCIWNGFTMQGREKNYTWSVPYIDNSQVVLVKKDSPLKTFADLKGKVVGVQADTPVQKALQGKDDSRQEVATLGKTFKSLVVMPNYNQAVLDLEMGAVDAVALDVGVAKRKMADKPGAFVLMREIIMRETYGIGFKKGNETLKNEVEACLKVLAQDGTMSKIAKAYGIEEQALLLK